MLLTLCVTRVFKTLSACDVFVDFKLHIRLNIDGSSYFELVFFCVFILSVSEINDIVVT